MPGPDWQGLFTLSLPLTEIIVRGTAMFWFLFLLFRFVMRRDAGSVGITDILVLVIIADAAQNAMSGDYKSIADGMVLVLTIVFWNFLLDWLSYRFRFLERLLQPRPLLLVRNGRIQHRAMQRELISHEELLAKMREQGVADISEVERAYIEGDGKVSVIRKR